MTVGFVPWLREAARLVGADGRVHYVQQAHKLWKVYSTVSVSLHDVYVTVYTCIYIWVVVKIMVPFWVP